MDNEKKTEKGNSVEKYSNRLGTILSDLDTIMGRFDYLQACIGMDIDSLTELQGEVCIHADKVAEALDLNRQALKGE